MAQRQSGRVTILDVAARAGVHAGTVSRALTRPEKVAPATRERVEAAVEELGFVPNRAARGLITGRTGNVAVIVPDITNPYFAALVRAIEHAARGSELQVLLVDTGERRAEEVRAARSLAREVDGFIVLSPRRLHRELDALGETGAVFVNRRVTGRAAVLLRAAAATDDALRHLASLGHKRLAYLAGPKGSWAAQERRAAVRRTSGAVGMSVAEIDVAEPTFEAAADAAAGIGRTRATAVVAFNDQMALGALAALSRAGVAVPGDVSVVGCDDVPMAAMVAPPLTTIHMPTEEAGAAAVGLLGRRDSTVELFGSLVVRGSTGPVTPRRATASAGGRRRPSASGRG
jgi:DNA-binding LacI/PurR family transcriptional regulator